MTTGMRLIVYPVKDLDRAKAVYGALLGTKPYADEPYYAGFKVGDQEVGLDPNGHSKGQSGPLGYWQVADIKAAVQELLGAGAQTQQEVRDVGGGRLIAWMKDGDGNVFGLMQG